MLPSVLAKKLEKGIGDYLETTFMIYQQKNQWFIWFPADTSHL